MKWKISFMLTKSTDAHTESERQRVKLRGEFFLLNSKQNLISSITPNYTALFYREYVFYATNISADIIYYVHVYFYTVYIYTGYFIVVQSAHLIVWTHWTYITKILWDRIFINMKPRASNSRFPTFLSLCLHLYLSGI